ncbi:uncharacterized protein BKA55DRAFT_285813 [Fusarium redolens]|uniref:Uncharacterized protein n=1 Tax=Fusarium redolens TaxID=48865 RepID=A0A9P9HQD0_FUSRE|nr:uncharacterized protein BKA55DRAFT_285813 [Fusarium redolens]KAH7261411.1 hypothetical protein BKA55DRAFT_285813 [Fusarium redolens]
MTTRTAAFVRQIRLNIELPRYSCRSCQWPESRSRKSQHSSIFRAAIQKLFTVLSAWKRTDPLVLELNTFSPSDSEHWFKNYCIGLDAQTEKGLETDVESSLYNICSSINIKLTILSSLIFTSTRFIPVILLLKSSLSTPPSSPVPQAPAFSGSPSTKRMASLDN